MIEKLIELHYYELKQIVIAPSDEEVLLTFGNEDMPYEKYAYDEKNRSIWKFNLNNKKLESLTMREDDANTPCFSPDGSKIAYISRQSGKKQLWCMDNDGKNKIQLTNMDFQGIDPFTDSTIKWSPDSKYTAYTVHPNGSYYGLWLKLKNETEQSAKIQVETGKTNHQELWDRARTMFTASLFIYNIETGENKRIVDQSNQSIMIHDFYPDENHLLINQGRNLKQINLHTLEEIILYNEIFDLVKIINGDLFAVIFNGISVQTGYIRNHEWIDKRTVDLSKFSLVTIHQCSKDGEELYFTAQKGVSNILYKLNVKTGHIAALTEKGRTVEDIPTCPAKVQIFHHENSILFPYNNPQKVTELWKRTINGKIQQLTNISNQLLPYHLPDVKVVHYPSNGFEIESLLVLPDGYDEKKSYPTLIYLHGGPEDLIRANFSELISGRAESAAHLLAKQGYVVFMPNFRGSEGYGEKFLNELGNYQFLQGPYEDVLAGIDYLIETGIANKEQLGIYGASYGAILTTWTIAHTNYFKGAIAMVGMYDFLHEARSLNRSFLSISENRSHGTIEKDLWIKPDLYKKISPMEHYSNINTPTLFIETVSERVDIGSKARPLFHALLSRDIPTNLVYYPRAYHNGGWNDDYKRDYMNRLIAWFDHCLLGKDLPSWFEMNE